MSVYLCEYNIVCVCAYICYFVIRERDRETDRIKGKVKY